MRKTLWVGVSLLLTFVILQATMAATIILGDLAPLSSVPVPQPISGDVVDKAAAVRLGKALFWEAQLGSDGKVACATCHFKAGADGRLAESMIASNGARGSAGVIHAQFTSINEDAKVAAENCNVDGDLGVTGKNAPTVIGAVFFRDLFWNGRARHQFNRQDIHGGFGIEQGGPASQAVGPPLSDVEMSCADRAWNDIATKLLARRPLGTQLVSKKDGVLGALSLSPLPGLNTNYPAMISAAFGSSIAAGAADNFASIFGQAIQAYEATLIPGQTPLDRFLTGKINALTVSQQKGFNIFQSGKVNCTECHTGPELSDASWTFFNLNGPTNEDGGDQGFHNIGVRPTSDNPGRAEFPDPENTDPNAAFFNNGAFKTPSLRNIGLTAPYFHDGGKATLEAVVEFYSHRGDFDNPEKPRDFKSFTLNLDEFSALVDFLRKGLTDCRVQKERAPFDHPALPDPQNPGANLTPAIGKSGTGSC